MSESKNLEGRIRDLLGDKMEIKIRDGLSICKPSKELDLIQIRNGDLSYYLELCDPDILGEVIDFVFDKKPEEEENNILPDDFPDDLNGKKKKGDPDPLDDNPFIPDFD